MKYCIVYGGPRKKNTYHAVQIIKKRLAALGPAEFTEFYLPQDFPKFCTGCYTCFMKGEEKCPHREYAGPIEHAMLEADGLIFASPVYVMEMAAPMKNMLDHFGYLFMAHRPRREMFIKARWLFPPRRARGPSTRSIILPVRCHIGESAGFFAAGLPYGPRALTI